MTHLVSVKMAPETWEQETQVIDLGAPTQSFGALLPGPATELEPAPVTPPKARIPWAHMSWIAVLAYTAGVIQGALVGRYL